MRRTLLFGVGASLLAAGLACQTLIPAARRATPTPEWITWSDTDQADTAPSFSYDVSDAPGFLAPGSGASAAALDEATLPFLGLFPELRAAPAPGWLRPGVRVTYRVESASIAQAEDAEGAAGSGYVQDDVIAASDELIVYTSKLYLDRTDGGVLPYGSYPGLGLPGVGDYWLNPEALVEAEQLAVDDLSVTRWSETFAGDDYELLRFDYTPEDAHYTWKFDTASGLLLEYRHDLGGDDAAERQLAIVTLAHLRQLEVPWAGEALPTSRCAIQHLHYLGHFTTVVAGSAAPALDYAVDLTQRACEPDWVAYEVSAQLSDLPADTTARLSGAVQLFDALWLPPAAFDLLEDGQVLDEDPVTGAVISVAFNRDSTLTLWETNAHYSATLTYHPEGWLVALSQTWEIGLADNAICLGLDGWD